MVDLATAVLDAVQHVAPWTLVLPVLARAVGAEIAAQVETDVTAGRSRGFVYGVDDILLTPREGRDHPLVRHLVEHADATPLTLDDVPDPSGWRTSRAYATARAQFQGALHHLVIPLPTLAGHVRVVGLARSGRNFQAREIAFARRLQPLLTRLDRHLRASTDNASTLTARERDVLTLIAEGETTRAVGRRLTISPRTVEKHLENAYRKLGVTDRLAAVVRAGALPMPLPRRVPPHPLTARPGDRAGFCAAARADRIALAHHGS